jgi:predicted transcriptional regulator
MAPTNKQAALKMIGNMPDDASLEDIMYELYFRRRVDRGLREFEEGRTVSHEEVKRSLVKWLQSAGR